MSKQTPDLALYIGRFQPLHLGHLRVIKTALKSHDQLLIGIGSSNISATQDNPFTYQQRKKLLTTALIAENIDKKNYLIFPIPDIENWGKWPIHVKNHLEKVLKHPLSPDKKLTLYTGSKIVKACFQGKYSTPEQKAKIPKIIFHNLKRTPPISATQIREFITKNSPTWQELVPASTIALIQRFSNF